MRLNIVDVYSNYNYYFPFRKLITNVYIFCTKNNCIYLYRYNNKNKKLNL